LNGTWNGPLYAASPPAFWLLDAFTHVVLPAGLLIWLAHSHGITPMQYGLRMPRHGITDFVGLTCLATVILWLCYRPVAAFFGNLLGSEAESFTYLEAMPAQFGARLIIGVYFSASAALFEEIMYRGLPYLYLEGYVARRSLTAVYTGCSAVLFGMAHWENGLHEVVATFSLGCAACVFYAKTRTLLPLLMAHFLIDIVMYV
jgi:membrane protease YdiL (CAAX protease family)